MSWPRPRLWTIGFGAGAVLLVAFAVWSTVAIVTVGRLRTDLEAHVGWLRAVEEAQAAIAESRAAGPVRAAGDELTRLAEELAHVRPGDDPLMLRLRDAGRGLQDVAAARTEGAPSAGVERDVQARVADIAPAIRTETTTIVADLEGHWRAMYVIEGGAIALAFGMLALLAYLRLVVLPRVDNDADRLHRLAHRLAQFDRAAHGMAHEINSPLTAIVTNLQLLAERLKATPPVAATSNIYLVEDALQGLARVSGTVQDMRSPSNASEGSTSFDPNAVIDAALATTRFRVGDSVSVALSLQRVAPARAPDALVQRLVEELLIGALLVVKSEEGTSEPITVKTMEATGGRVAIELGVPQRAFAAVDRRDFERRLRALGGQFVASVEGTRASVRLELPTLRAAEAEPAAAASPRAPEIAIDPGASAPAEKLRILLVDDDELVRTSVTRVLAKHDVTTLSDGDEAVASIVANEYDLVLCDLMMPGKSGMEVYEAVVERRPDLAKRFVFISGGASTPEAEAFLEAHASERLDKPFGMESLRRLVAEAGRRAKA